MKIDIGNEHFFLFRYASENDCYVAVPHEYMPFIEQAEKEYGGFSYIPSDQTVRGIFIKTIGDSFDVHSQQSDVTIKNLARLEE